MRRFRARLILLLFFLFNLIMPVSASASLEITEAKWESGDSILVVKGLGPGKTKIRIKDADTNSNLGRIRSKRSGEWAFTREGLSRPPCNVKAVANGEVATASVENACSGGGDDDDGSSGGGNSADEYVTLAVNDLGMHCADIDYQIFSILPPYNVLHSQVIRKGSSNSPPLLLGPNDVDVYYQATASTLNTSGGPVEALTSYSATLDGSAYKGNFWQTYLAQQNETKVIGGEAYNSLYHGLVDLNQVLPADKGLPAPDVEKLYLGDGQLATHQQDMPGLSNTPQKFAGFIKDFPFFTNLPFGYVAADMNRHTAEGIPILPVTDNGWENAYPLMQVTAVSKGSDPSVSTNHLASVRATVPVADEADCQACHANQDICDQAGTEVGMVCSGIASDLVDLDGFEPLESISEAPGATALQRVLNASKINILRLHDAKHDTQLDQQRQIVCASCHYSPALDLAQLGPTDTAGKEQTQHDSMSRVMHKHHADTGEFPLMPPPVDEFGNKRSLAEANEVLGETCYACHPGKRAQCLRGAMTKSGIVCQDCHGNMEQVGDDFSRGDDKRIPWASEPGCQSCHTGDAVNNMADNSDVIKAADGIRLLQAFRRGDVNATPILALNKRFAETQDPEGNDHLYRLSKGHGGVMCEGCHGSTHAIWPNPMLSSNDNLTSMDLQGHTGTLTECDTCHEPGSLGLTMDGPHGMHPVNDFNWTKNHKEVAEHNGGTCKTCHGGNGEGTVLARTAVERVGLCKDEKGSLCSSEGQKPILAKGTEVSCTLCHGNYINE
ncbi:MAG: hypothetical protein ACRBB6_11675 [Neptuniibacter sp.]